MAKFRVYFTVTTVHEGSAIVEGEPDFDQARQAIFPDGCCDAACAALQSVGGQGPRRGTTRTSRPGSTSCS